jgi:hypothetical protein
MGKKQNGRNLPATTKGNLPANLAGDMALDGKGDSSGFEGIGTDDLAIPFLTILQSGSPQVKGSTKIKGASEGMFFNTVTGQPVASPIRVVPCIYQKCFVEWVTRDKGGGFVAIHHDEALLKKCKRDANNRDILPNGNQLVRTAYHYCLQVSKGGISTVVIGMSSTQLKRSRRWNSQAMALKLQVGNKTVQAPYYSHSYKMGVVEESNDKGSWWSYDISDPQLIKDAELYAAAKEFHHKVAIGSVRVAPPPGEETDTPGDSDTDGNTI